MMKTNQRRLRIKLSLRSLASSFYGQIRISRPSAISANCILSSSFELCGILPLLSISLFTMFCRRISSPMMKTNKRRLRIKLSLRSLASSFYGQIRISRPSAISANCILSSSFELCGILPLLSISLFTMFCRRISSPMMKTNKRRLRIKLSLRSLASSFYGQIRISRPSAISANCILSSSFELCITCKTW